MDKDLNVFLSSKFDEFKNARRYLSRKISEMPYLECIPQEAEGALPQGPKESSVEDAKKCDILVGILGDWDSETTRDEIDAVIKLGKYRLIYVTESETRDEKLNEFINRLRENDILSQPFKKGSGDLYTSVLNNLRDNMYRILDMGRRIQSNPITAAPLAAREAIPGPAPNANI